MKWKKLTAIILAFGMCLNNGLYNIPKKKTSQLTWKKEQMREEVTKNFKQKARESFMLAKTHDEKKAVLKSYLKFRMQQLGYTPKEYQQVKWIWSKESAFNWNAEGTGENPALGIAQIKYSKGWQKWNRDPFKQMEQGLKYINRRYDSVDHAYNHKVERGWY